MMSVQQDETRHNLNEQDLCRIENRGIVIAPTTVVPIQSLVTPKQQ